MLTTTFPAALKARRLAIGMTQTQLARKAFCHHPDISEYECGKKQPTIATVTKLAKALRTAPKNLLGWD